MRKILFVLCVICFNMSVMSQTTFSADRTYHIRWNKDKSLYVSEEADGSLISGSEDVAKREFWEFIPVGSKKDTYYIRNKVTGNYIQSCNKENSSSSRISTGVQPVEYFVGTYNGAYWLSSTDCENYNDNSKSPHGLNKDGASSYIITWMAGTSNTGSYWQIEEVNYSYEIHPFISVGVIDSQSPAYHIVSSGGKYLSSELSWLNPSERDECNWYFVGESNSKGGYEIVNSKTKLPIKSGSGSTKWIVVEDKSEAVDGYGFVNASEASEVMKFDGHQAFTFRLARSPFARQARIYDYPCGTTTGQYFSQVELKGNLVPKPLIYPIRYRSGTTTVNQTVSPSGSWYKVNVMDKGEVCRNAELNLNLKLQKEPVTNGDAVFVYFDWNRDGVFETEVSPVELGKTMSLTTTVPADAALGETRMRLRVTNNGLTDADADVAGQTVDFVLNVVESTEDEFKLSVMVNDTLRGKVEVVADTVKAIPFNSSTFVCWKEGKRVLSVSKNYAYTLDHNLALTAYFSADRKDPFGESVLTGISPILNVSDEGALIDVEVESREIRAKSSGKIYGLKVFSTNGSLLKSVKGTAVSTEGLIPGTYVVRVYTDGKGKSLKVWVK